MLQTWQSLWLPNSSDNIPFVIVVAYVLASGLAAWAACRAQAPAGRRFWWVVMAGLLLLAYSKQFDLQGQLTEVLRERAWREGWYQGRQSWQFKFIIGEAVLALAVGAGLMWLANRAGPGVRPTLAGLVLVGAYIVLRAASFHPVDVALRHTFNGVRLHNFVELGCILVVMAGELRALLRDRGPPTTRT